MVKKKISPQSWPEQLKQALAQAAKTDKPPRLALVGLGNEFNGDDAAGVTVAHQLKSRLPPENHPGFPDQPILLVLETGLAPENFTGVLRRFAPHLVVLVDAAQMNADPGEVRWLDWESAGGLSASTHSQPPSTLAHYLIADLDCKVALLGIQPAHLDGERSLSPPVRSAIHRIVDTFSKIAL